MPKTTVIIGIMHGKRVEGRPWLDSPLLRGNGSMPRMVHHHNIDSSREA